MLPLLVDAVKYLEVGSVTGRQYGERDSSSVAQGAAVRAIAAIPLSLP
jgi:hypothetical protein